MNSFRYPASASGADDSIYTAYQLPGLMPAGALRSTAHGTASADFISMKNLWFRLMTRSPGIAGSSA